MQKQILTADSGSTSTNWALIAPSGKVKRFNTKGINPYYLTANEISGIVENELLSELPPEERDSIGEIFFYGSGCSTPSKVQLMCDTLSMISQNASVFASHDVLASARAACGEAKGIACILGTGSNSCVYDGKNIIRNAISLGYLLGDEGSGIHLGKLFLTRYLKNRVSPELKAAVDEHFHLTFEGILNGLYEDGKPNRFIAQFSYFVLDHTFEFLDLEEIVRHSFNGFVREYLHPFPEAKEWPICFVGSVASLMQDILRDVLGKEGYSVDKIIRYPIDGLIEYHKNNMK